MSKYDYHPSARVEARSTRAERKATTTCTWSTRGFSCECDTCKDRLTSRQLDLVAAQAARALKGRI